MPSEHLQVSLWSTTEAHHQNRSKIANQNRIVSNDSFIADVTGRRSNDQNNRKQIISGKLSGCCSPFFHGLLLGILTAGLILAIVITLWLTSSKNTLTTAGSTAISTTMSSTSSTTPRVCTFSCLNQTWISTSGLLAKWTFDTTFSDATNTYNTIAINSPLFISKGYINQALTLNASSNQYLYTSYIPLINAAFTVEAWLYPTGFPNLVDHSILGLCTFPGNDQCLHLTIRNVSSTYCLYMSFFGDSCSTTDPVPLNTWTHVAFTFDNITLGMLVYMNGQLVRYCASTLPLQGIANNITIGYVPGIVAAYGSNFFQGNIDQLKIFDRPKSACEILDDATLSTYYTFNDSPVLNDSGPNSLLSTSQSVSFVSSGHSSKAISFNNSASYLEIAGLTALGIIDKPFSISLWIRPYSLSGTLVFVSQTPTGTTWCAPFLGFATNGSIVAQVYTGTTRYVFGPALSTLSVWYHIVQTWSSTNGLRLYIDKILVASNTLALTYMASSASNYVRIANRPNNLCGSGAIGSQAAFYGDIDDFKIYSRELTINDVCVL